MKIELNGTFLNGRIDGLEEFRVTLRFASDEKRVTRSFTSELVLYDDGYSIIKANLIDNPNGFADTVPIRIFDDCCKEPVFEGVVRGDTIDWCEPGCSVTITAVENDAALNCVKSSVISDFLWNGTLLNNPEYQNPRPVRYCLEERPAFMQFLTILILSGFNIAFFSIIIPIITVLAPIIVIILAICNVIHVICSIPGIGCTPPNCGGLNPLNFPIVGDIISIMQEINNRILACGRGHPSHYVRTYIRNVCARCGLTFQSSILNDPASIYYNSVLFAAEVEKGVYDSTPIFANRPILTLEQLLNEYLNITFNADWRIINGVLIFERKDFFFNGVNWIDTEQLINQGRIIDGQVCFTWIDDDRPAYGNFAYTQDSQEYIGNEAKVRFDDIVEWNIPVNEFQAGELKKVIPFGAARFRDDGLDLDVYSFFVTFAGGIVNALYFGAFSAWQNVLLMNQHTALNYKLLIIDETVSDNLNAFVRKDYDNTFTGGNVVVDGNNVPTDERFNYPYWFQEGNLNNLYSLFHYIDNPRQPQSQQFEFDFSFVFECDEYKTFDFDKAVRLIQGGSVKQGTPEELEIDFINRIIRVKGKV